MTGISKNREKLRISKGLVLWLFDFRCIICGKPSNEVHEIIPVSHGSRANLIKNRVVICRNHHTWAHNIGTNKSIIILREKRKEFLIRRFDLEV